MSLKFTALEVGSGDAFLIEDDDKKYLFDSGGNKILIANLLKNKKIKKLDLAICSHNDIDHANGFIGLLDPNSKIEIEEIWLPGDWASILKFVKDGEISPHEIICYLDECDESDNKYRENYEKNDCSRNKLFDNELSESIENFEDELSWLSEMEDSVFFYKTFREWHFWYDKDEKYYHHQLHLILEHYGTNLLHLQLNLKRILDIVRLAYQRGCKIRWFEPTNYCTNKDIDYGFRALNAVQMASVKVPKDTIAFMQLLTLTKENEYSLVFEYLKNNIPIIRFSADSNCTCQSIIYDKSIIVTAPHHGSEANANVYSAIQGNNIIWVRSDRKSRKRPCADYKMMSNKYCLACYNKNFKKEICFYYDCYSKKWKHKTGCKCPC